MPSTSAHCSVCGFPTALAIEALRSLSDGDGVDSSSAIAAPDRRVGPAPPSPESEVTAAIARDLKGRMDVVGQLGRGAPDLTDDLCQAALSEAEGRTSEALDILRTAQSRLEDMTDELLRRRLNELEERHDGLRRHGVSFAVDDDLRRATEAVDSRERDTATVRLVEAERRLAQFESDWNGLEGLLTQIERLRNEATDVGIPLGEIDGEIARVRESLATPNLTEDSLDAIAQQAAQTLMLLHEAIPTALEEELARHEAALGKFPDDHPTTTTARRLHVDTARHLSKGRLSEAVTNLRELRRLIVALETATPRPSAEARSPVRPPSESEEEMLDRLLKKARSLAARVRTLPPESDTAQDAALRIREATDLLRARRLSEADDLLTLLMKSLALGQTGS